MKVLMHLHSFTYDYHLRTLTRFVCGVDTPLRPGYHITGFLDDFLKYYSKAPNYAYSLVHSGRSSFAVWFCSVISIDNNNDNDILLTQDVQYFGYIYRCFIKISYYKIYKTVNHLKDCCDCINCCSVLS